MRHALLVLCLAANAAGAQTIYTWVDEDGTVNYSDTLSGVPQGVKVDTTKGEDFALINLESEGQEEGQPVQRPAQAPQPLVRTNNPAGHLSAITGEPLDEYHWRSRFRVALAEVASLEDDLAIDKKRLNEPATYGYGPGILCGGYVPPSAQPPAYRATDQLTAMQARATIKPAPGVAITGDARVANNAPVPPPSGLAQHRGYAPSTYGGCIATPSPDFERLKDKIEKNTAALKRAQEALADLERQASHHGVPREWRKG